MLTDSAASKLRAKARKMSQQDLQSEDGFREKQRLQAHDEAKSAWAASQGKLLRATPLKRSAAARLRSLARDTASIKATPKATMKKHQTHPGKPGGHVEAFASRRSPEGTPRQA